MPASISASIFKTLVPECSLQQHILKIGMTQRRLSWPLHKNDTQIREVFHKKKEKTLVPEKGWWMVNWKPVLTLTFAGTLQILSPFWTLVFPSEKWGRCTSCPHSYCSIVTGWREIADEITMQPEELKVCLFVCCFSGLEAGYKDFKSSFPVLGSGEMCPSVNWVGHHSCSLPCPFLPTPRDVLDT